MKGRLYIDGKFLFDLEPLVYPKLTILSHEITDYLVYVHSYKGDYCARLNGTVWRVCGENYCYTKIFPSKEAAEDFVANPMMLGGYGYDRLK